MAILWPGHDEHRGRHALSQAIYALRRQLGADALQAGVDDVRLNPAVVSSDVEEFRSALASGHAARAADLYAGPFLDGFSVPGASELEWWIDEQRRRLERAASRALEGLAARCAATGEAREAAEWWRRRAALDPLDASAATAFMEALAAAGDRVGALRHAELHARLLRDQLDLGPDPAVGALAARLRDGGRIASGETAPPVDARGRVPPPPAAPGRVEPTPPVASPTSEGSPAPRRPGSLRVPVGAAITVVLFALTVALAKHGAPRGGPTSAAPVVLGSLAGPDVTLSLAVREALRAELESAGVRVLDDGTAARVLRHMGRPADAAITDAVAVEVAERIGAAVAVTGSVTPLGTGAQLVTRVLRAADGGTLASALERPADAAQVLPAVAKLAREVRRQVTGLAPDTTLRALPAVTTTSLDALRDYARARQALAHQDRARAIVLLRSALVQDDSFALAHYLLGDLLWYVDHQTESEQHLARALQLGDRLPPRERLIVRARYEQLVRDLPDSALSYWRLLRADHPDEPLAYEGIVWADLDLGHPGEAAVAAAAAVRLDSASAPQLRNELYALLALRDTSAVLRFGRSLVDRQPELAIEARLDVLMLARRWSAGLALIDSLRADGADPTALSWQRHALLLALGRVGEGAEEMEAVVAAGWRQAPPRALLLQARVGLARGDPGALSVRRTRQSLDWLEGADLSAPAVARIAERVADAAARARDTVTIRRARRLVVDRDAGRGLRSFGLALLVIDASDAFARGRYAAAARLARDARQNMFFGRSLNTLALLEADARRAAGQGERADSLYLAIAAGDIVDGDLDTWVALQPLAVMAHDAMR